MLNFDAIKSTPARFGPGTFLYPISNSKYVVFLGLAVIGEIARAVFLPPQMNDYRAISLDAIPLPTDFLILAILT